MVYIIEMHNKLNKLFNNKIIKIKYILINN
jgi:hypothetical protein